MENWGWLWRGGRIVKVERVKFSLLHAVSTPTSVMNLSYCSGREKEQANWNRRKLATAMSYLAHTFSLCYNVILNPVTSAIFSSSYSFNSTIWRLSKLDSLCQTTSHKKPETKNLYIQDVYICLLITQKATVLKI